MMKRKRSAIVLAFLVLLLCVTLFACKKSDLPDDSGGSSENSADSTVVMQTIDLSQYAIVYPKEVNDAVNSAVATMWFGMSDYGLRLPMDEQTEQRAEYEILFGNTDHPETQDALARLTETQDYIIRFYDKKIVIAAKNDLVWEEAALTFVNEYVAKAEHCVLQVPEEETFAASAKSLAVLIEDGRAKYELVFGSVSDAVKTKTDELVAAISELGGAVEITVGASYDPNKNQILIGPSTADEIAAVMNGLQEDEYILQKIDNKLLASGKNDVTTMLAIRDLIDLLQNDAKTSDDGKALVLPLPSAIVKQYKFTADALPEFTYGTYVDTYPCGNGNKQLYYTQVNSLRIDRYVEELAMLGFVKKEENTIGNNRYITCMGNNSLVHLSYIAYNKTLSILLDPLTETVYKDSEPTYTKVTETALAVMSLDFSHREALDGNGMSYVVTLEDGRYIIFDGGYQSANDVNILYNYLEDNNKRPDGKIVIAAWVMTHPHGNHHGAFQAFTSQYATRVEVQYFIYNDGDPSMYTQQPSNFLSQTLPSIMKASYPNAKAIKPHTGQILTFCNVTFEVMYTQESYAPNKMPWVNDASLVLRMNANGVKTLFTGDCEQGSSNLMSKMYGTYLQSDILQINHHGYSGGTVELYQYVNPSYSVWPTSQVAFENRTSDGKLGYIGGALSSNQYIFNKLGTANCFVADGNIEILTFTGGTKKINVAYYTPDQTYRQKK